MKNAEIWLNDTVFAAPVAVADSFFLRFRGLMLRRALVPWDGLLLKNCSAIHCFFMRFPIDAVYLDGGMRVAGTETVYPWRIGGRVRGARHVLELEKGRAAGLKTGMQLELKESESE